MTTGDLLIDLALAKSTLRRGKVDEAEPLYRDILEREPSCAEAVHYLGVAAMGRGRLDEALRLIRRSIELEPQRREFHNNLSTVLGQMNQTADALKAAEEAIKLEPDSVEAWNNKGFALDRLGKMEEAVAAYQHSLKLLPSYAGAMTNLGAAFSRLARHEEAIELFSRVARQMPRSGQAHLKLATAFRLAGRMQEAADAYRAASHLMPRNANLFNDLGGALQEAGNPQGAEAALRQCLAVRPDHPDGHWNLALSLLTQGRWHEGWPEYEWRQKLKFDENERGRFTQPAWKGEPAKGKTILVSCEQGLGDTIQFCRYAPLLRQRTGAKVIFECQGQLIPLLSGLRGIDSLAVRGGPLPPFDMHARLMSLPLVFRTTPTDVPNEVPYLRIDERQVERFRTGFSKLRSFKVGIVWQGNRAHRADRFRSIALAQLAPLAQIPGVRLISLQKGPGIDQIPKSRAMLKLFEWADPQDISPQAWVETAAVMQNLELILGVDTAVCHVAGALGLPVWLMVSIGSDWRWMLDRSDTPWYPTMQIFRQRKLGQWKDVMEQVAGALRERVLARPAVTEAAGC